MAEEGFKRKLAAILSADVEGYSRLMDDDEEATVRTLTSYRTAITDLVQQYRGRVVDSPGDNILAEFASVVDSVNCAVEIQRELAERNAELPDSRKMQFRIGVNLGDVIDEDGRIYGDGVNIAARVESLAEAGGICISGRAHTQVENKLGLEYEDLGKHEVKNISRPIQVYRVLSYPGAAAHRVVQAKETLGRRWRNITIFAAVAIAVIGALTFWQFYVRRPATEPASVEKMAYPLPDKPSIAVLPFVNMSGDAEQEYISDSITENIITALSYLPDMFVIARTSTSVYKGKAVQIGQISEELGVRYVLEGSIQKTGDRIRVTAQLIDAIAGHHLWAERYDREIANFFDLLDEITKQVVIELQVKLAGGEISRISHRTANFEAWASATIAYSFIKITTRENIAKARELFERAVKLDPQYGYAWGGLGAAHNVEAIMGWSESPQKSHKLAVEYTDKALMLDETLSCATSVKGSLYRMQGDFDQAITTGKKAIALGPSHDLPYSTLSQTMLYAGRFDESITLMKKAMRLDPRYPAWYLFVLANDYLLLNRNQEAIEAWTRLLERAQKGEFPPLFAHLGLAAAYARLERKEDASAHAAEVLKINPKFSLEYYKKFDQYKNKADFDRYLEALRKAGLPDNPPLPLPDKPSIAVLAFDNLSGDPEQEYFSDGIAENIITALSKVGELFVIARNSSFTYKGKPVKVQQIGRELGVRYVLEGSVQKSGDRVRITAQLIDAKNGQHIWAERYDRELKDIFALQDQIAIKVLTAVRVVLTDGERALVKQKEPKSLEAYLKILKGREEWRCQCKEGNDLARNLAADAISLDPEYSAAYHVQSQVYFMDAWLPPLKRSVKESLELAIKNAQKAVELDSMDAIAHGWLGYLYTYPKLYEQAITQGEKAVQLAPNSASAHFSLGTALAYDGRYEEAIKNFKKMSRLSPRNRYSAYHVHAGLAYILSGQYELAISEYNKAVQIAPKSPFPYMMLAPAYILSGEGKKAQGAVEKLLELNPKFSVIRYEKRSPIRKKEDLDRIVAAMRKAGLPE
jgi:TolB-like protein/class 3 adenylate cyclase/Flp pilus assembly protein TadD